MAALHTPCWISAAEASGKLVAAVRRNAEQAAGGEELVIIDGSPGIGCAVIASLSGVDLALVVTEPSVSGMHDLDRILKVARHFGIEALVCINKHDLSPEMSERIAGYCATEHIDLVGSIPFDPQVLEIVRQEKPVEQLLATNAGKGHRGDLAKGEGAPAPIRMRQSLSLRNSDITRVVAEVKIGIWL